MEICKYPSKVTRGMDKRLTMDLLDGGIYPFLVSATCCEENIAVESVRSVVDIHISVLSQGALKIMRIFPSVLRASCDENCNVRLNVGIQQAEVFCFKVEMLCLCLMPT